MSTQAKKDIKPAGKPTTKGPVTKPVPAATKKPVAPTPGAKPGTTTPGAADTKKPSPSPVKKPDPKAPAAGGTPGAAGKTPAAPADAKKPVAPAKPGTKPTNPAAPNVKPAPAKPGAPQPAAGGSAAAKPAPKPQKAAQQQFDRKWVKSASKAVPGAEILNLRLMHWNILAQKLATQDAFRFSQKAHLAWAHRGPAIGDHILESEPDVLGICELDTRVIEASKFDKKANQMGREAAMELIARLEAEGYGVVVSERSDGMLATGVAYKKDKVVLLEHETRNFGYHSKDGGKQDTRQYMICHFAEILPGEVAKPVIEQKPAEVKKPDPKTDKKPEPAAKPGASAADPKSPAQPFEKKETQVAKGDPHKRFIFIQTHLKAMPEFADQRTEEAKIILAHVTDKNWHDLPVFISGDYNDEPSSKVVQHFTNEGCTDLYEKAHYQIAEQKAAADKKVPNAGGNPQVLGKPIVPERKHPEYTLICDTRKNGDKPSTEHLVLDYIMLKENTFSKNNKIQVDQFLDLPAKQDVKKEPKPLIPGLDHVSDHFSLVYDVSISYDKMIAEKLTKDKKDILSKIGSSLRARVEQQSKTIEAQRLVNQRWKNVLLARKAEEMKKKQDELHKQLRDKLEYLAKEKQEASRKQLLDRRQELLKQIAEQKEKTHVAQLKLQAKHAIQKKLTEEVAVKKAELEEIRAEHKKIISNTQDVFNGLTIATEVAQKELKEAQEQQKLAEAGMDARTIEQLKAKAKEIAAGQVLQQAIDAEIQGQLDEHLFQVLDDRNQRKSKHVQLLTEEINGQHVEIQQCHEDIADFADQVKGAREHLIESKLELISEFSNICEAYAGDHFDQRREILEKKGAANDCATSNELLLWCHDAGLKMEKINLQLQHQLALVSGDVAEADFVTDPVSGKKSISTKLANIKVARKAELQREIDELNIQIKKNFDRLQQVMAREDQQKTRVASIASYIERQKIAIKTQYNQLTVLNDVIHNIITAANNRGNFDIEGLQSGDSLGTGQMLPHTLLNPNDARSERSSRTGRIQLSSSTRAKPPPIDESKLKKAEDDHLHYTDQLSAFAEQIKDDFDATTIRLQQEEKLRLATEQNTLQKAQLDDQLKAYIREQDDEAQWMNAVLFFTVLLGIAALLINHYVKYGTLADLQDMPVNLASQGYDTARARWHSLASALSATDNV